MQLQERLAGLHRELDALAAQAAREREERLRGLQLAGRSLRQAESTAQWVQMLADAAAPLAREICFFRVDGDAVLAEAARGMALPEGALALSEAPALRQAVDTRETVVSLLVPSQLGPVGVAGSRRRAHLFPLVGKTRVLGVMLAADEAGPDVAGLEVLMTLGAASLELRETQSATLIRPAAALAPVAAAPAAEEWPTAARFARMTVAEWVLAFGEAVGHGRAAGDLYDRLRDAVDAARATYEARYLPGPDRLHEEMVTRLALGNAKLLGASYPGPLGALNGS